LELLKIRRLLESGRSVFDLPLRVAYYARVSTDKDGQRHSLHNQIEHYDRYIEENPNWTPAGRYVDEGVSGTGVAKREQFLRMVEDARAGRFDFLVTKEISRFSRNTLDSIRYTQELLAHGVGVLFEADNICTFSPDAELRLTIMASIAQDEVRRTAERVKFGFKRAVERGRVLGADNTTGYRKKDGVLTVDEAGAALVRRVFAQYAEGRCGLRRIARDLQAEGFVDAKGRMYSYASLHGMLKNPKYKGYYCGRKYTTLDYRTHKVARLDESDWVLYRDERIPPLVSEELWDRANALLRERGARMRAHAAACQSRYPYSGKLFCGAHGDAFHRRVHRSRRGARECWYCRQYRLKGRAGCDSPAVHSRELDIILADVLHRVFADRAEVIDGLAALYAQTRTDRNHEAACAALRTRERALRARRDKLLELYVEGVITKPEFAERNGEAGAQLAALTARAAALEAESRAEAGEAGQIETLRRALETEWADAAQNGLGACLLERAVVRKAEAPNAARLELRLKTGQTWLAALDRTGRGLSLCEIGISQAQVSRLEKNAFQQIRKNL
jgi:DNA invertase Pin-like site-specific DNA recombinase